MATIYPRPIPLALLQDPSREAERQLYDVFADRLRESYRVFYNVAWLARTDSAHDGETDFIVTHPEFGVLVIEVKGGGIGYDGTTGEWSSVDRHGRRHVIHDPVAQAVRSKKALLSKIKENPNWQDPFVPIGHAVAFPQCEPPKQALTPALPQEVVISASDLGVIESKVESVFHYWKKDVPSPKWGGQGVRLISDNYFFG